MRAPRPAITEAVDVERSQWAGCRTLQGMSDPQEQFTALWHTEAPRVMAFASRHVGAEAAHDVVAETFMIAWRRWGDLPTPPIGWLLVTARKVIQNRARANRRSRALEQRIALLDGVAAYVADSADAALTRREALERLARLGSPTIRQQRSWASSLPRSDGDSAALGPPCLRPQRPTPSIPNPTSSQCRSCHEHP